MNLAKSMVRRVVIVALAASLPAPAALAARWSVAPGEGQKVGFHSTAPMESFDGTTDQVRGFVELDEAAVGDSIGIEVRVDMASLDTGIGMRNRHMRENHLHTERFPEAVFRGGRVTAGAGTDLRDGASHEIAVAGQLDLHGVVKDATVTLTLTRGPAGEGKDGAAGDALRIAAEFPVALADHDIPRPRFLFAKLGEVQRVYVGLAAAAGSAKAPSD